MSSDTVKLEISSSVLGGAINNTKPFRTSLTIKEVKENVDV